MTPSSRWWLWVFRGPGLGRHRFSLCKRRNAQQNLSRLSRRKKRRTHLAGGSRWKHPTTATADRLRQRVACHYRSDGGGEIQDFGGSLRRQEVQQSERRGRWS